MHDEDMMNHKTNCMTEETYIDNIYVPGYGNVFTKWANGKNGAISDIDSNCILRFLEINSKETHYKYKEQERKEKSPILASGIVAWWLLYRRTKAVSDIFEEYYQMRFKQYKDKREKEADSWKCNLEEEFLFNHCLTREQDCVNTSQAIFNFVSEEDGKQIHDVINNYFAFIGNKELLINIKEHMNPEEMVSLEYKILDILSLHGKEINANLKDSKQIYDFSELRLYTEAEIREASIDMQTKGWITCFIDHDGRGLGPAYWHELLDEGRKALRKHIECQDNQQNINETSKQQHKLIANKSQKKIHFKSLLQCTDKESKLAKLHQLIDGFGGKHVALIFLKAREEKIISKLPSQKEFESEFKNYTGVWRSISYYFNPNCPSSPDFSHIVI